jgi:6-phosphogluconolactonase (cycloisomerase 2 family)
VIDPVTGGLAAAGIAASVPGSTLNDLAITPDGSFLYLLRRYGSTGSPTLPTLTAYSIDAATSALTVGATVTPGPVDRGHVIDPLGRFRYVHESVGSASSPVTTTMLPYAIDSATGALTAVGSGTSVLNNGGEFVIEPSGRFGYLLDTKNFSLATDNHIDAFSIDPSTGVLTTIGTPTLVHADPGRMICDTSGRFLLLGASRTPRLM